MVFYLSFTNSLEAVEENSSFGFLDWACVLAKKQICYLWVWLFLMNDNNIPLLKGYYHSSLSQPTTI